MGEFLIDVNSELFECEEGDKLTVALATSLSVDGVSEAKAIDYARGAKASLLDQFDYAMHGTVYKFQHVKDTKVEVYVSHGGLLARFRGDQRHQEAEGRRGGVHAAAQGVGIAS